MLLKFTDQKNGLLMHSWINAQGLKALAHIFIKNGPTLASFLFIFGLFKQTLQIFRTNICEKMSIQETDRTHNLLNVCLFP